jgi:hypothetical protein
MGIQGVIGALPIAAVTNPIEEAAVEVVEGEVVMAIEVEAGAEEVVAEVAVVAEAVPTRAAGVIRMLPGLEGMTARWPRWVLPKLLRYTCHERSETVIMHIRIESSSCVVKSRLG